MLYVSSFDSYICQGRKHVGDGRALDWPDIQEEDELPRQSLDPGLREVLGSLIAWHVSHTNSSINIYVGCRVGTAARK